jgi:hypothetical protein
MHFIAQLIVHGNYIIHGGRKHVFGSEPIIHGDHFHAASRRDRHRLQDGPRARAPHESAAMKTDQQPVLLRSSKWLNKVARNAPHKLFSDLDWIRIKRLREPLAIELVVVTANRVKLRWRRRGILER